MVRPSLLGGGGEQLQVVAVGVTEVQRLARYPIVDDRTHGGHAALPEDGATTPRAGTNFDGANPPADRSDQAATELPLRALGLAVAAVPVRPAGSQGNTDQPLPRRPMARPVSHARSSGG